MKILSLGLIENKDGFRFVGIDKDGEHHYCIVRRKDDGNHYMVSNTVVFSNLVGWIPDTRSVT